MKNWSVIQVMKLEPSVGVSKPYRLVETYMISEGIRSRLCSGSFATIDDALVAKADLETNTALN